MHAKTAQYWSTFSLFIGEEFARKISTEFNILCVFFVQCLKTKCLYKIFENLKI